MPPASSRAATDSLASMRLTLKCLPMSRSQSMADISAVHSRLLTMMAAFGPSKSRYRSTWDRMRSTQPSMTSGACSARSLERPLGSPTRPVAPPTSPIGRCPAS